MKRVIVGVLVATLLLSSWVATAQEVRANMGVVPPPNIISWWPGDENPDVIDNFNDNSLDANLWEIKNFVLEFDNMWTTVDQMSLQERNQRIEIYGTKTNDAPGGQGWYGKALVSKLSVDPTKDFTLEAKVTMAGNFTGSGESDSQGHIGISIDSNNWIYFGPAELSRHGMTNQIFWRKRESGVATQSSINFPLTQGTQYTLKLMWFASTTTMRMFLDSTERFSVSFNPASMSPAKAYLESAARWYGDQLLHYWDDMMLNLDPVAEDFWDGNHGKLMNGAGFMPGKVAQAFCLDGNNDFILVPNSPSLNPTSGITLDAWVFVTGKQSQHRDIISKDGEGFERQYLLTVSDVNRFRPHVGVPSGFRYFDGATTAQLNRWYHVAMTYDRSSLKLYVDGALDGSASFSGDIITTSQPVRIGGGAPSGWPPFHFAGLIDEVEIFNRALSATEIQAIYDAGSAGKWKDKTPPTTTISLDPPNPNGNNGWYTSDVTVTLTADDNAGGSEVKEIRYAINGGVETVVAGALASFVLTTSSTYSITYFAKDNAGNVEATKTQVVKIDQTPPTISGTATTTHNANGWYNADVTVHFDASDALSGIDTVTPDTTIFTEGANQSLTGTATDKAGNSADCTPSGINIDKTPPVITINSPVTKDYLTSESLTFDFSVTDALSGIASSTATLDGNPVASGDNISLAALAGSHTLTVSATDKAGNSSELSVTFSVVMAATADIDPNTLNLKSQSDKNAITAYIELPSGYEVEQIDVATVKLMINEVTIDAQLTPTSVGDHDGDRIADRMVKFNRQAVITALTGKTGDISMIVTGQLTDGRSFTGSDTIKVIAPGK